MAKHIKTNKIKKRKAAKKTLRKTKRIRQKGKKQSGGLFWRESSEWEKFLEESDEEYKEMIKNCNNIINANFYPPNHPTIKSQLFKDNSNKEAINKNKSVTSIKNKKNNINKKIAISLYNVAINYWENALNGNEYDKIKYRPYFGRSMYDGKNPLIKICIMKKDETGAAILQDIGSNKEDRYVKLKPFEENDQFKNYEIYQSESNTQQKNTNNNPKKPNDSQNFVKNLLNERNKEQKRIEQKYNKEYQIKKDIKAEFEKNYEFIKTGALNNDSEYYYYNFPCRSSINYMSDTKDNEKWKNNKYYILHPEDLYTFFNGEETEELAKEIKILTDRETKEPVKLTGNDIDYYFPPPTDNNNDDYVRRENHIAARKTAWLGDSCKINKNEQ